MTTIAPSVNVIPVTTTNSTRILPVNSNNSLKTETLNLKPFKNDSLVIKSDENDNKIDEMYNSLLQLAHAESKNHLHKRVRKLSDSSVHYEPQPKTLTSVVNETYFTNGKPSAQNEYISEIQEIIGQKRDLYSKTIRSIGTSLKNCDQSDMISIDIDPESTRLPLMCKLMIIVEGAAFERGTRVLVRDAGVQCEPFCDDSSEDALRLNKLNNQKYKTVNDNDHSSLIYKSIPIHIEKTSGSTQTTQFNPKLNMRHKSSDCLNNFLRSVHQHDHPHHHHHCGSLKNLNVLDDSSQFTSNYFKRCSSNKKLNQFDSCYLDLLEHQSVPYYQYMRKNLCKEDFCGNTIITYNCNWSHHHTFINQITRQINTDLNNNNSFLNQEAIDVFIPLNVSSTTNTTTATTSSSEDQSQASNFSNHKNERQIFLSDSNGCKFQDPFEAFRQNMRKYLQERMSRFEAEITLTSNENLNKRSASVTNNPSEYRTIRLLDNHPNILSFREINDTLNSNNRINFSNQHQQQHQHRLVKVINNSNSSSSQRLRNGSSGLLDAANSVTNLMYMKVVDGHLLE
jgi:hypothetical protein